MEKKIFMTLARCFYAGFVLAAILLALLALTIGCGKSPGHYETLASGPESTPATPPATTPATPVAPSQPCALKSIKGRSNRICYICGTNLVGCDDVDQH